MIPFPPHSAASLARAMIQHQLGPEHEDPRCDDSQNLFATIIQSVVRMATSRRKVDASALAEREVSTPALVDRSASAVSTAFIMPFQSRRRPDDEEKRAA